MRCLMGNSGDCFQAFYTLPRPIELMYWLAADNRLLRPRPTFRGIWMGVLLLWGAAAIILPIIRAEGIRAVFFPWSLPRQRLAASNLSRHSSSCWQQSVYDQDADARTQ